MAWAGRPFLAAIIIQETCGGGFYEAVFLKGTA
jgi:hypothetical protein